MQKIRIVPEEYGKPMGKSMRTFPRTACRPLLGSTVTIFLINAFICGGDETVSPDCGTS